MASLAAIRSPAKPDTVEDLLRELVTGQRQIIALLDGQRRPVSPLSRADRALLARLMPAIAGALGSELFNSAEVVESDAAALRLVCAGLNAKQLGRLLRRAADIPIVGYLVERVGLAAGAVLWRVVQVPEFPGNEKVSVPHAPSRGRL